MNKYMDGFQRDRLLLSTFLLCIAFFGITLATVDESFFSSCRVGDVNKVRSYLDSGTSVHSQDSKGNTCMIIASGRGAIEVIKLLISYGANTEDATAIGIFEGKTAISWASSQGRLDAVAILIQAGADPQRPPTTGVFAGKNALMWAASQGRTEVVKLLLSTGIVEVDFSSSSGNFKGKTALMWASSQGRVETVEALLEAGADVNAADVDGVSALMWASGSEATGNDDHKKGLLEKALKGHVQVVQLLLKYGAKVDMKDKDFITAIMFASFNGHAGPVQVLLNAGANADYLNRAGKTALQLAKSSRHSDVVRILEAGPTFMNASSIDELKELTTCGWLLSILRAPVGTGIIFKREFFNRTFEPNYSVESSCALPRLNGLDNSLYDLLSLTKASSVEEVVNHLGPLNFAARTRAILQLNLFLNRFQNHFKEFRNRESNASGELSCS